jgi:hypothetical protein
LIHGCGPILWRPLPLFRQVFDGKIKQLGGGLIIGEMLPGFNRFAQAAIQALDGVCGVDYPSDFVRIGQEGNDLLPIAPP